MNGRPPALPNKGREFFLINNKMRKKEGRKKMHLAVKLLGGVVLVGTLAGCASTQGGNANLQARVIQLERTVSQQEQTIDELRQRASMPSGRSTRSSSVIASHRLLQPNRGIIRVPVAPKRSRRRYRARDIIPEISTGRSAARPSRRSNSFRKTIILKLTELSVPAPGRS